jgi:asparagine synthase (glutamine-hydrolysing)
MAVGLEVRVPMLDYRLVELSARMPVSLKLAGGQGKRVLRRTVEQWLGASFADAPKHGFDVPTDAWFRGPLREVLQDTLLSTSARCRTWLDADAIDSLVHDHVTGRSHHGQSLWTLFMLEQWAQAYAGRQQPLCEQLDLEPILAES